MNKQPSVTEPKVAATVLILLSTQNFMFSRIIFVHFILLQKGSRLAYLGLSAILSGLFSLQYIYTFLINLQLYQMHKITGYFVQKCIRYWLLKYVKRW